MHPFHLAFLVDDLENTIAFYTRYFNCRLGRQAKRWVDIDFFGHQLSFHLRNSNILPEEHTNPVDGDTIRIPHFGVILDKAIWESLHQALHEGGVGFVLKPKIRFKGQAGEQGTFFRNVLEFKYFNDTDDIFARDE